MLALSHPGRHQRDAVCTLLLCAGPIEGCSAVLGVCRYCGFRSLVCVFVVCAEEEAGQVEKQNSVVFVFPGDHGWWSGR